MGKKKASKGLCVYCGERPAATRDHVIPKCLFDPPLPANMVTVPACEECNNLANG
jgi:5-methylcytosine-specific restriction endonuclease McrA